MWDIWGSLIGYDWVQIGWARDFPGFRATTYMVSRNHLYGVAGSSENKANLAQLGLEFGLSLEITSVYESEFGDSVPPNLL